jgi:chloramphenicol 3-O phosphotransferase
MPTDVILLNGPSSAGKTSLARAIQKLMPEPWLMFGVDHLIFAMPAKLHGAPEGLTIHPGGQVDVGPVFKALELDWRRGLGALARSGLRLVLDEVIFDGAAGQRSWNEALSERRVLWVGVKCDVAALVAREKARGDRDLGMAAKQAPFVHEGIVYDLEVDTTHRSTDDCAAEIVARALV